MNWKDRYDTNEYELIFIHVIHNIYTFTRLGNRIIVITNNPTTIENLKGYHLSLFTTNFDFKNELPDIYFNTILPSLVVKNGEYNYIK